MRIAGLCAAVVLTAWTAGAWAHAHLQSSVPAEGSTLKAAPQQIVLRFSEAARLTALWIQKDTAARQKVESLPEGAAAVISVAVPPLAPGHYTVSWRVLSDDGHVMSGQIHFTVAG